METYNITKEWLISLLGNFQGKLEDGTIETDGEIKEFVEEQIGYLKNL